MSAGRDCKRPSSTPSNESRRLVALPAGFFIEFTGAADAENRTRNELALYSGLALAVILMVLSSHFDGARIAGW